MGVQDPESGTSEMIRGSIIKGERYDAQIIKKTGNKYPSLKQYYNIDASEWLMIDVDILVEEGDEFFYLTFGDFLGPFSN